MRVCGNGKEKIPTDVVRFCLRFEMRVGSLSLHGEIIEMAETFRSASGDLLGIGVGMYIENFFHSSLYTHVCALHSVCFLCFLFVLIFSPRCDTIEVSKYDWRNRNGLLIL